MSPLLVFFAGCIPSFAAGALARPYIDRLLEEAHMPAPSTEGTRRWRVNPIVIMLAITNVVAIGGFLYSVYGLDAERRQSDQDKAAVIRCFADFNRESSRTTKSRSDAAERRDEALVASKKAMREWVRRILEGETLDNSPAIRQAALQYIEQTGKFIAAQEELDETRQDEPVTLFTEDYCSEKAAERKAADR